MRAVVYVEIDIRICSLTYGVSPCTADGPVKCFNSPKTCQDRFNIDEQSLTLRFGEADGTSSAIDCIRSLVGVDMSPGRISLGEDLGVRASVTATFADHPHADTGPGFDKYLDARNYDPFKQGTFWGKFVARHPYLQGRPMRVIRGFLPDSLSSHPQGDPLPDNVLIEQDVRHYVVESLGELQVDGTIKIVAKDILKLADDDKALWPRPSSGRILADIDSSAEILTLAPTGIGDEEYAASGVVMVGGKECMAYTRSGDVMTITRGQKGTSAQAHSAGDRVQVVYSKTAITPAEYLDDLFRLGAGVPDSFIPRAQWDAECATYLGRVYSMDIAEPTPVRKLASEMIQQAALAVWQDDRDRQIKLRVLRPVLGDAPLFDDRNILSDGAGRTTLRILSQPDKRVSEVHTWFGQSNAAARDDDPQNYRASRSLVDSSAAEDWIAPAIRRIYSRLIPPLGAAAADRINEIVLSRFRDPPRRLTFRTFARGPIVPAAGMDCRIAGAALQDATGLGDLVPAFVTRVRRDHGYHEVEAEEARGGASPEDLSSRELVIAVNTFNVDLLAYHNTFYPEPQPDDDFVLDVTIEAGVIVGSLSAQSYAAPTLPYAFDTGTWPAGVTPRLTLGGRIQGAGGRAGGPNDFVGLPGGGALKVRHPIEIITTTGQIWGGGGGGGGRLADNGFSWAGGGGAGSVPGSGQAAANINGSDGTAEAGGLSGWAPGGGNGGAPGQAGQPGHIIFHPIFVPGGAPGAAIDGVSLCTFSAGAGDRRGPEIN